MKFKSTKLFSRLETELKIISVPNFCLTKLGKLNIMKKIQLFYDSLLSNQSNTLIYFLQEMSGEENLIFCASEAVKCLCTYKVGRSLGTVYTL